MDIKWLKTFVLAAEYENFRQASEDLFLTQPAITKHIKRLEEHLNTPLFNRIGKSVVLTPAGHKFLPYARGILAKYEQSFEDFESWKQGYNRKLMIATAPQIASSILPSLLRDFMEENRGIEVILNILQSYDIGEEINSGKADIGLSRIHPAQSNVHVELIHEEPVVLVANGKDVLFDESTALSKYRLITHNHPEYWDDLLIHVKHYYPTIRTMTVNGVEITKRFIEAGLGVSFLPLTMVKDEMKMGKLVEIPSDKITPPQSATYVVTKVETVEAVAFIRFLKNAVARI